MRPEEFTHNDEQLTEVARRIFHGEPPGPLLGVVPDEQLDELAKKLGEMNARRDEYLAEVERLRDEHVVAVQAVFPVDDSYPSFAYTVGLWPEHGGELLARGFGQETMMLVQLAAEWVAEGVLRLEEGNYTVDELLHEVRIVPWPGSIEDFAVACRIHGTEDFGRWWLQAPDDNGRFPGDEGCEVETYQTLGLDR